MCVCQRKRLKDWKEEKRGRQTPRPSPTPARSPCHVVSTPAMTAGGGRGRPIRPSLSCASPVWGFSSGCLCPLRVALREPLPPRTLRGEINWRCRSEHFLVPLSEMSLRMGSQPPASRRLPSFPEGCTSGLPRGYPRSCQAPWSVAVIPPGKQNRNLR